MTFIQEFEQELSRKLSEEMLGTDEIVQWACEKVLESYRNGIKAGKEGVVVKRDGKSRGRPYQAKAQ